MIGTTSADWQLGHFAEIGVRLGIRTARSGRGSRQWYERGVTLRGSAAQPSTLDRRPSTLDPRLLTRDPRPATREPPCPMPHAPLQHKYST
jgi:hypothetical protein